MPLRRALFLLPLAVLAAGCFGGGEGDKSKAVAHVGGTVITHEQLDETVDHFKEEAQKEGKPFPEEGSARYRTVERQALGLLVYRTELLQSAARLGVPVTDEEVERRAKAARGEAEAEGGAFIDSTIRSQIAYEHVYRKVTSAAPEAMSRFLSTMKREYAGKVSYEPGFGPSS